MGGLLPDGVHNTHINIHTKDFAVLTPHSILLLLMPVLLSNTVVVIPFSMLISTLTASATYLPIL